MAEPSFDPVAHPEVDDEFELTPADLEAHHRLVREMVCSLPRTMSCRLCPGERDCPYIVDRPYGRLVVHKRPPHAAVALHQVYAVTGRDDVPGEHRWFQVALAVLGWAALPGLVIWAWVVKFPGLSQFWLAGVFLIVTFVQAVIGVPLIRRTWRDRGGTRRTGG